MASRKKVTFVLEADDLASKTMRQVGKEADSLKAKIAALASAGTMRGSAAGLQRSLLGGNIPRTSLVSSMPLSAVSTAQAMPRQVTDYGLSSLISSGVKQQKELTAATESLEKTLTSLTKMVTPAELQRSLLAGYQGDVLTAVTSVSGSSLSSMMNRQPGGTSSDIYDWLEKGRGAELVASMSKSYGTKALEQSLAGLKELGIDADASSRSVSALAANMQKVARERAFRQLADDAGLSHTQLAKLRAELGDTTGAFSTLWSGVKSNAVALGAWTAALTLAGKAALDATVRMDRLDKSYATIEGSSVLAREQLDFVYEVSNRLGLQFQDTAESAKTFFASMKGTSIEKDANRIFESVSKAATALSLSQEQVQGVYLALGQMASKGKVQAEELRGQLGERLPGAFQMAAKAMGMTTAELDKAMELGQVTAEEMLPKLADVLENRFGRAAEQAADGLQQGLNRVSTEWERFKASILDSEKIAQTLNMISSALKEYNDTVETAKRRSETVKEMREAGIVPLGEPDIESGYIYTPGGDYLNRYYTDEQIKEFEAGRKAVAEYGKSFESANRDIERALSNNERTVERYLKDTEETRKKSLDKARDEALKAVDDMIAARQKEGKSYDDLLVQREKVQAEYERKLGDLNKKYTPKTSGAAGVNSALSRIEDYRREISTLRGDSTSASAQLEKMLASIESTGEKAKLSAQEIAGLKKEYSDAWSTNQIQEFNRELMDAQGNTAALKNLEVDKAVADWTDRLKAAGLSTEEATGKAKALGQAMRESVDTQNLETVNDVLKELEEKTGQYGLSIESSNRLIEQQVKLWRQAGVPEAYIEQLRQIKEMENSRDGWAGAWLGTQEYFAGATDLAEGFKSVTVNAFSSMEDAITTACTTGKVSFSDMVTSMSNDLVRLMVRNSVTGPLASVLSGGIASLFGGGTGASLVNASSYNFAGKVGSSLALGFHNGGVVGVGAPTFSRSVPEGIFAGAPRFHSGTGYIKPGEYPAILKRGERVLNPQETQAYQREGNSSSPTVNVNIVNSTGQQATTRTRTDAMGNKTIDVYVGDMAAKQMNTPGTTLNRAVSAQTGQTRRAIRR